jgi:ankyrin repeat protein
MTEREGQTALYGAVKFAWARVVAYLMESGAAVDIVDALGKSPIDAALGATGGRDNMVSGVIAEMLRNAVDGSTATPGTISAGEQSSVDR